MSLKQQIIQGRFGECLPPQNIHYSLFVPESQPTKAAILLLHGMQEHSGRYTAFAEYLKDSGYLVLTYDHPGHGKTAKTESDMGFFQTKNPHQVLLSTAEQMAYYLVRHYPDLPCILMGHSMGSFVARCLLKNIGKLFNGAIIIGTGGPNPLARMALPLLSLANKWAPSKRSRWLNQLFTKLNNQPFKHEPNDNGTNWLSINLENRKKFLADPLCGADFSNNAFLGLITLNVQATLKSWGDNIPHDLPFLFVSGAEDPIGDSSKGVQQSAQQLRQKGFESVEVKIYPDMRHEILNEDNNTQVYQDIVGWLGKVVRG